jgi:hypothetical protein
MGTLSYTMSISLDGYIEDATGGIAFSEPDEGGAPLRQPADQRDGGVPVRPWVL